MNIAITGEDLEPGQVWKYHHREGEKDSRLSILRIDYFKNHTIVHIRLDDIKLGKHGCLPHLPFSIDAIMQSITEFDSYRYEIPDYVDGYNHWLDEAKAGRAGFWTIQVKDAIEAIAKTLPDIQ